MVPIGREPNPPLVVELSWECCGEPLGGVQEGCSKCVARGAAGYTFKPQGSDLR